MFYNNYNYYCEEEVYFVIITFEGKNIQNIFNNISKITLVLQYILISLLLYTQLISYFFSCI